MPSTKLISSLLLSLAFVQATTASPLVAETIQVRQDYPEVIPGPGLPSLSSLNLTSAQLYEMGTPETAGDEMHTLAGYCGPSNDAYTHVNGVIACMNYLRNLGTQQCSVRGAAAISRFCESGDARVIGQGTPGPTSSYCRDVASAVLWIVNSCTRQDQSCAGNQAAGGNGNLLVGAYSSRYI